MRRQPELASFHCNEVDPSGFQVDITNPPIPAKLHRYVSRHSEID